MKILLGGNRFALVDSEDFEHLNKYHWWFDGRYAVREKRYGNRSENKRKKIYMHRFILDVPRNKITDHINDNKLDNRKFNLRICTQVENQQNRKRVQSNNTSGYRGVCWNKTLGYWLVQGWYKGKKVWVKYFKTFEEAVENRKKFEKRYFIKT